MIYPAKSDPRRYSGTAIIIFEARLFRDSADWFARLF